MKLSKQTIFEVLKLQAPSPLSWQKIKKLTTYKIILETLQPSLLNVHAFRRTRILVQQSSSEKTIIFIFGRELIFPVSAQSPVKHDKETFHLKIRK